MMRSQRGPRTWMRPVVAAGLTLSLAVSTQASGPSPYDGIVVFGTSLSDPGNAFVFTGDPNTPPDYDVDPFLVPNTPYARGGLHATNGATWIEQFARTLGLAGSVRPAFRGSNLHATNYAIATARAYDAGLADLGDQFAAFLFDTGGTVPSGNLYVIEMGSHDVNDALALELAGQGALADAIIAAGVASIVQHIGALYTLGARDFLVWTVPDIGLTPATRALDAIVPGAAALATQLSIDFNTALAAALAPLEFLPGIDIDWLDAFALMHQVVASPSTFGLTNVTDACITPGVAPFTCQRPADYLFWDGIHPTAAGHAIIADEAASALAP